jgi:hypothetical protein
MNFAKLFGTAKGKVNVWLVLFLEHIFKKMGSTEIVVSSVRPSVRLLFLSRYGT